MSDEGIGCVAGVIAIGIVVLVALAIDYVFMVAWNYVMPEAARIAGYDA